MSQFQSNRLTRRSLLKASASILPLPFLESALATIEASGAHMAKAAPKRMLFIGGGFGFTEATFYPKQSGEFQKIGLTEGLTPLKKHMNDVLMVSNISNSYATNPHGGSVCYLTAANTRGVPGKSFSNTISCDQIAAKSLGKETRFQSLVISAKEADGGQNSGHGKGLSLSWDAEGNPIPGITSPLELYKKVFFQKDEKQGEVEGRIANKRSILDTVKLDGAAIRNDLSKVDRDKLDEYFQGLRQIELGLQREAAWARIPKPQAPFNAPAESMTPGEQEIKVMYDILIAALQTDSTRIATYRLPVVNLLLGMEIKLKAHALSHYGFSKPRTDASRQRDKKCMTLFAHFLDRLKEAKDMDGSRLFDNCIVSYGSNLRTGHQLKNLPALISGGAAGVKLGQHIQLPKKDTPLANLWLTLMQQGGVQVDKFSHSSGTLKEILS